MLEDIRKISVGPDYKSGAMHYIVGQRIFSDSYEVHKIIRDSSTRSIFVYIMNEKQEVVLWKEFNSSMPISIEFNIDF